MTAALALLSSLLWGGSDFLGGTASRRLPAFAVVGYSQGIALAVLVPLALLTGATGAPTGYLWWAAGAGLVGLVSLGAFYAALAGGTMGVVAPLSSTGVLVPVTVGLVRGEPLAPAQLAGIGLAVAGVVLASGPAGGTPVRRRPVVLALAAALGFGTVTVLLAQGARSSVVMTLLVMRVVSVGAAAAVAAGARRWRPAPASSLPLLLAVGLADLAANGLYAQATRSGLLAVVAVLASLYPAVTVLLARQVHHERLRRVQWCGVGAVLAGVVLLSSGGGG